MKASASLFIFFLLAGGLALTPSLHAQTTVSYSAGTYLTPLTTTVANPLILFSSNSSSATQSGTISGDGSVTRLATSPSSTFSLTLSEANTYTGATIVDSGTLTLSGANASLASTSIILNGGLFLLDNTTYSGSNNNTRLADTAAFTLNGGSFLYRGANQAATHSTETIGTLTGGDSTLTVAFGGLNSATLTAASLTSAPAQGSILINGERLGRNTASTINVSRFLLTSAPTLVGTTAALATGINSAAKNTEIVPFLVGEATSTSGGMGTATGVANTFLTYNATTGLRPLNPTDEFTQNAFTAGANVRWASGAAAGSVAINSLILNGSLLTAGTLTITSGALLIANSGSGITGGTLVFGSAGIVTVASGAISATIASVIAGTNSLTKSGPDILVLSGANTYAGGTFVTAGTLRIGSSERLADSGALTINGGTFDLGIYNETVGAVSLQSGTITRGTSGTLTASGFDMQSGTVGVPLAGSGTLTKSTSGKVILTETNTYTGGTVITDGTLEVGSSNSGSVVGDITNNATLIFNRSNDSTFDGIISGSGTVIKNGGGTLTLSGLNTHTGGTTVSSGLVEFSALALGAGTITLNGGGLRWATGNSSDVSAALTALGSGVTTFDLNGNNVTFSTGLTSPGTLTKMGTGTLTLAGTNSFAGTSVAAGTLQIGAGGTSGSLTGNLSLASGASVSFSRSDAASFAGVISGAGALQKVAAGTLTLTSASSFSGGSTLSGGTLAAGHNSALGTGTVDLAGGALAASGGARSIANAVTLTGDSALAGTEALILTGSFTLARNRDLSVTNSALTTISGAIGESGGSRSLLKYGAGILELTGANTYTGGTTIAAGTVRINNLTGSTFGSGAVTVASGATLTGAGSFTGALQNNGDYEPGNSPTLATLSSFSQGASGTLTLELGGLTRGADYDAIDVAGSFAAGGNLSILLYGGFNPTTAATFDLFNWGALTGAFASVSLPTLDSGLTWNTDALYTSGSLSIVSTAIPEPSDYALLLGAVALVFRLRRRGARGG